MNGLVRLITLFVVIGSIVFTAREIYGANQGWIQWVSWSHHLRALVAIPLFVAAAYVGRAFSAGDIQALQDELEGALHSMPPNNSLERSRER